MGIARIEIAVDFSSQNCMQVEIGQGEVNTYTGPRSRLDLDVTRWLA